MQTNPVELIMDTATALYLSSALHVAANLGLADAVAGGPMKVAQAAEVVGANADALRRVIRLLASKGIFTYDGRSVGNSAASELLRSDVPGSLRNFVSMLGNEGGWVAAQHLGETVRTGVSPVPRHYDGGLWGFYASNPNEGRTFDAAMEERAISMIAPVLEAYDFSSIQTLADIAGGRGHLLRAALRDYPEMRGIVFDLPGVVEATEAEFGAVEGLRFHRGSFFDDPLPEADGYLLMDILHDWDDHSSEKILRAIRAAAKPHSRLLVIEFMVGEGEQLSGFPTTLDVIMMALFSGRQRSAAEVGYLAERSGFKVQRVLPAGSDLTILEALPA